MLSQDLRQKYKFQKSAKGIQSQYILACGNFNNYLPVSSPQEILDISKQFGHNNCIAEYNEKCKLINPYFDFDKKEQSLSHSEINDVILQLRNLVQEKFPQLNFHFFIKDASNLEKTSLHFIMRMQTNLGEPIYFRDRIQVKSLFNFLELKKPFDVDAYSGHCLRTLFSDKYDKNQKLQDRPFLISKFSDIQDPIYSLSCYCPNSQNSIYIDEYVKKQFIIDFVHNIKDPDDQSQRWFNKNYTIDQVIKRDQDDHLSLQITEQKCHNRQHESNNCVCMLFYEDQGVDKPDNITIKCHDNECKSIKKDLKISTFQINIVNQSYDIIQQQSKETTREKMHAQNATSAIGQLLISQTGDISEAYDSIGPQGFSVQAKQPPNSFNSDQLKVYIGKNNECMCQYNGLTKKFPFNEQVMKALSQLTQTYTQNQLDEMGVTINIFNIQQNNQFNVYLSQQEDDLDIVSTEKLYDTFFVQGILENEQIRETFKTYIFDNIDTLYEIIPIIQQNKYVYSNKKLYYYSENENCWIIDENCQQGKTDFKNQIQTVMKEMQKQLRSKKEKNCKYLKGLIREFSGKVNSYNYNQYAYLLQQKNNYNSFDQIDNLIYFLNTTYDFEINSFIQPSKVHKNTQSIKYQLCNNFESYRREREYLYNILEDMIPKKQCREWLLSSFSESLNAKQMQKPIIFMKGSGRNGKSILIDLVMETLQCFSQKASSSIFSQDTIQDSNKATTAINPITQSRICFIEEIQSTTINIEKLKELTGGSKIQIRRQHQEQETVEVKTQFYVACNSMPKFQHIDQAMMNRILGIQFETEFVDNPVLQYQKKADQHINKKLKNTNYLQAFMSILIDYSKIKIDTPQEVKFFTNELQQAVDKSYDLFDTFFEFSENPQDFIKIKDHLYQSHQLYYGKQIQGKQEKNQFQQKFINYMQNKYQNFNLNFRVFKLNGKPIDGMQYIKFKEN